jgi:hypothetical protein
MLHAVTTPLFFSVVLGGLLGGATLAATQLQTSDALSSKRLVLHAVDRPNSVYLSAFRDGDLHVELDGDHLSPLTFKTRAAVFDGCRWLGVESLTPLDHRSYSYRYDEYVLECDCGATPTAKTPRTGLVVVHDD